jgi:hypothetical protein
MYLHVPYDKPRRWKDNIKMHLQEIVCENERRIHIAQDYIQWWVLVPMVLNI